MFRKLKRARPRAVVAVQVLVTLPVLLGLAAVTVDVGMMYNTRTDLQRSADAGALAAIGALAYSNQGANPSAAATQTAKDFVESNPVMGHQVTIDPATDVVFGRAHFDVPANDYNFVPGGLPTNAVRVTVRQTKDSPNGSASLYFAGIFGKSLTDISASAVAIAVNTHYDEVDCHAPVQPGETQVCHYGGDKDDSDDSAIEGDDSDDSDSGEAFKSDSESQSDPADSDSPHTVSIDSGALGLFLHNGDSAGPCNCPPGDIDDSDDSAIDGDDSDDSDHTIVTDSDGSVGKNKHEKKIKNRFLICHIPPGEPQNAHTITVDDHAWPAHQAHGDTMGQCAGDFRIFLIK